MAQKNKKKFELRKFNFFDVLRYTYHVSAVPVGFMSLLLLLVPYSVLFHFLTDSFHFFFSLILVLCVFMLKVVNIYFMVKNLSYPRYIQFSSKEILISTSSSETRMKYELLSGSKLLKDGFLLGMKETQQRMMVGPFLEPSEASVAYSKVKANIEEGFPVHRYSQVVVAILLISNLLLIPYLITNIF